MKWRNGLGFDGGTLSYRLIMCSGRAITAIFFNAILYMQIKKKVIPVESTKTYFSLFTKRLIPIAIHQSVAARGSIKH